MSAISLLSHSIKSHGAIRTVRVSSAQARGAAKKYSYWGTARYQARLGGHGRPTNVAVERASSDRRSRRLAEHDCAALAEAEGRLPLQTIGLIGEAEAWSLLEFRAERLLSQPDEKKQKIGEEIRSALARMQTRRPRTLEPRPLTLEQRLLVRLARAAWPDRPGCNFREQFLEPEVRAGKITASARWLTWRHDYETEMAYRPLGDERDIAAFAAEENQELRRIIVEACGERVVPSQARNMIQQDDFGKLYEIHKWDGRRSREVRVVCPSTGAVYWLPVSQYCCTAHEAVAQSFGMRTEEYTPFAQS